MRLIRFIIIYCALPILGLASDVEHLTLDNYADLTNEKAVFLMFYAPWCGHSKKMAPEWSRLAEDWGENENGLVAKIDCTDNKAKPLCKKHKVYSFPAIHYGDAESLEMYEGGRSYEDLSLFANEIFKPICKPSTLESCDDDTKILVQELIKMSDDELRGLLKTEKKALKEIAKNFKLQSKNLQHKYQQLTEEKNSKVEEIMDWGLELARYVKIYKLKKITEGTVKEEL